MVAAAVGAGVAVAGLAGSAMQSNASESASESQAQSAREGIAENRFQFDAIQKLLAPYSGSGVEGLGGQKDLVGLNGSGAQAAAIAALENSSMFSELARQGEGALLQNASATGGLRGGNTQAALAQFRPQMLTQLINDQYSKLGGITSLGQNAAAGVGNAGMATGGNVSALMQQIGAAQAGGALAQGNAAAGGLNAITSGIGVYGALGGFRSPAAAPAYATIGGGSEGGYVMPRF